MPFVRGNTAANAWHGGSMPQSPAPDRASQALTQLQNATRQYQDASSPQAQRTAREALHKAITVAVQAGIKQAQVARASGLSKAQVSRLVRGATSGRAALPPAEYLLHKLPVQDIVARYQEGESATDIGEDYGCSNTTILDLLRRNGVARRAGRMVDLPVPDEELARRYVEERAQLQDLAAEFGVTVNLISRRLAKAGVVVPVGKRRMDLPDAEIVARYRRGETVQSIARSYGVSFPTIKRRIREDRPARRA